RRNVAAQCEDSGSTLHLCRDLIALRRTAFAGQLVAYERLPAPPGVWAYRSGPLQVTANFSAETLSLAGKFGEILAASGPAVREPDAGVRLQPWQGLVARAS